MKRLHLILIFLCLVACISAQDRTYHLFGRVCDEETKQGIPNITIQLLRADSTLVKTYQIENPQDSFLLKFMGGYDFEVSEIGKYIIKASHLNYETAYMPVEIRIKRQNHVEVPVIRMKRISQMLNEVVVKASKVKMVMRGDTIVFNADAFNLAEGSMLDALIAQLPGTELSKDGEIKVNGKRIESLLIDGRSFFEGDPKSALQNLPAYTVNKVKVFDRKGKLTEMMGRNMDDKSYVMDVRLKRQYQRGWMGNFEAGSGTQGYYKTKMMSTMSTPKSRFSLIGNLNNLSDQSDPTGYGGGMAIAMGDNEPLTPSGTTTYRKGGFSYSYGEFEDPLRLTWSGNASHDNAHTDTWTSAQTFLSGGDTFNRSINRSRNRNITFDTRAEASVSPKGFVGNATGQISYNNTSAMGDNRSAVFDADPNEYNDILNDLFIHPEKYRQITLNRQQSENTSRTSGINASMGMFGNVKLLADMLTVNASTTYSHTRSNSFALSVYDYIKNQGSQDYRNNYTHAPNTNFTFDTGAYYNYGLGQHGLQISYGFNHQFTKTSNLLYRLDKLSERDSTRYDMLPSAMEELARVLDNPNSYTYTQHNNKHNVELSFRYHPKFLRDGGIDLRLPLVIGHQKLDYFRQTPTSLSQTNTFLQPSIRMEYTNTKNGHMSVGLTLSANTTAPDLTSRIDYRDDSNPLSVTLGNPNLKNSHVYNIGLHYYNFSMKGERRINGSIVYSQTDNARASETVYDRQSGITTSKPTNVNGNWNASADFNYGQAVTRDHKMSVDASIGASLHHSVDLMQVVHETSTIPTSQPAATAHHRLSHVDNSRLNGRLSIRYLNMLPGRLTNLSAFFNGSIHTTTGSREGFRTIHASDFSYGMQALSPLVWKTELSANITNFCHRGYSDHQMNRDEWVCTLTLSRTIPKAHLTVSAEAFDLLGQLSNRRFTVNEQGRTETYTNVTPRYFMFKLTYRFNKFPKNKKSTQPIMAAPYGFF